MDIGTSKPDAAARAAVPHHLLDLVDPDEEFTVTQFQRAARLRPGRHRAARPPCPAGGRAPGSTCASWSTTSPSRAATPTCGRAGGGARRGTRRAARISTPAWPSSTRWRPGAWRRPTAGVSCGRSRSRSGRGGPSRTSVPASRPTRTRGSPRWASPWRPTRSTGGSRRASPPWSRRVWSRRCGRWRPGPVASRARPARRLGYREILGHLEEGVPLDDCLEEAVRRTRQFARRQASWFRRDPRITWAGSGARGPAPARDVLDVHG